MKIMSTFSLARVCFMLWLVSGASLQQRHSKGASAAAKAVDSVLSGLGTTTMEPEGGHMVIPESVSDWSGHSAVPTILQYFLAFSWIGGLCSIPALLRVLDSKPVTRSEIVLGASLVTTLLGGLYLFTQVILFQSPHFHGKIRPLTVVECIYLMAQIITTVGYGDITPAKSRGQVFVGLYVLGALLVISMLFSKLVGSIVDAVDARRRATDNASHSSLRPQSLSHKESIAILTGAPQAPDSKRFRKALVIFAFFDICWILFFHFYPGEGKTWFQAVYMSVITLSTVGFGAFTPVTEGGMIFGAFWMLFGSVAMVNVVSTFTALVVQRHKFEQFNPKTSQSGLEALRNEIHSDDLSEAQFLRLALLSQGLVPREDVDRITDAFHSMKPRNGAISIKELQDAQEAEGPLEGATFAV